MKGIRFFAALYAAKLATVALSVMHRNGTHMPGVLAMKICPDFLGRMDKPKTIIGITGTNGKTTTANMINDILADNGYSPVNNRAGSNILGGVATTLISAINLRGKTVKDLAVLELDERSSRLIYPYVHPTYLLCTNLFRDSYKRNAHSEFIFDILDKHIPKQTKLVLNADDLVSARLAKGNDRVYFGIEKQDNEVLNENTIIIDTPLCPECGSRLEYDFRRYHHIGSAHCTKCGFRSPKADYDVTKVNESTGRITMSLKGKQADFKAVGTSVTDTYNLAGAIAVLSEFGLSAEQLKKSVEKLEIVKSRYDEEKIGDKQVIMSVAKGQNPVACSRVFSSIKNHTGKKAVVLMLDDLGDAEETSENTAWIYDTDFEFLNDDSITQVICSGVRRTDYKVRLLLAGVPEEKITCVEKESDAANEVDLDKADTIFFLYDVYTTSYAAISKNTISDRMAERGAKQ